MAPSELVHAAPARRHRPGRVTRPELRAEMLAGMEPLDELLRSSGQYGPAVPVPEEADVQTPLLGFIGRDPNWSMSVPQRAGAIRLVLR